MILYEVNLDIDAAIAAEYRAWLDGHAREMLALPGFLDAQVYEVVETPPAATRLRLCVHYRMRDLDALDAYLREHAPRLRAEGTARFGQRFSASRRVLRGI